MISKKFHKIIKSWNKGDNSNDIYHLVLYMINDHPELKKYPDIKEILERMSNNESSQDIVEDFVYGERYENLRKILEKM